MSHNENSIADEGESWYGEFHPGGLGWGNFKLQPSSSREIPNSKLQIPRKFRSLVTSAPRIGDAESYFQDFLETGEVAGAVAGDEGDVLEAHPAQFRVVKARLDGDDVAGLQTTSRVRSHARSFMDFQTEAVAGAMEKAFHPPMAFGGLVALLLEEILDGAMHLDCLHAGAHFSEGELLSLENGV